MLFNSISFLVFFPLVFFSYWLLPGRLRPFLLLAASLYFYMVFVPKYILVLFTLITIDYFLAQRIEQSDGREKKWLLSLAVISNIGLLFVFKYFNFFNENIAMVAKFLHWNYSLETLSLLLPLGLSFHVFQSLAYIIEVHKGRYRAEKNYLTFSLYVMFFPQLVAGPIERPKELIPQLQTIHTFNRGKVVSGLRQMLWGFFKKIVVASPMAVLVDFVYHHSATADASALLLAVVLFYFVLYADFSGYTDIALGSARMLGIELVENFDQPYFARSITEFWRRWHISLSNWFRDYLFYPLAWNFGRFGKYGLYGAIIITFTLMGVWHGAGWNFLIMGFLFGLYIVLEQATLPVRDRIWIALGLETVPGMRRGFEILATFMLTAITWIFFRVKDFGEAMHIFSGLVSGWGTHVFSYLTCSNYCAFYEIGISRKALAIALLSLGIVLLYESVASGRLRLPAWMNTRLFRWLVYYFLMLWLLVFGYFAPTSFIYFQF